jgi:APA family basic amino acid/polyamine antiporter
LTSAVCLVIANMIGTGVFTTSGFLIADLKSPLWVVVAWFVGGVIALLGASCYGALGKAIPESGGEYLFLRRTLHPAAGSVAGWISLFAGFSAPIALAAFGFGDYLNDWLPGMPVRVTGSLLIAACAVIHAHHVTRGAFVQNVAVIAKLVLLAGFVAYAASRLKPGDEAPVIGGFDPAAFATSLVWISFSYSGWNAVVYIGSEIRDPDRNLARSLVLGAGVVTFVYVLVNAVFVFGVPAGDIAGQVSVAQIAARQLGGDGLANGVTAIVVLALATSVSAMVMAGPRVYARMAEDGFLPRWLRCESGPPRAGIALQLALALVLLWTNTFQTLISYTGFTLSLGTGLTVVGLMRLKRREPELPVAGWPWVPVLFLVFVGWTLVFSIGRLKWEALWGIATVFSGWLIWWVQSMRSRRASNS